MDNRVRTFTIPGEFTTEEYWTGKLFSNQILVENGKGKVFHEQDEPERGCPYEMASKKKGNPSDGGSSWRT